MAEENVVIYSFVIEIRHKEMHVELLWKYAWNHPIHVGDTVRFPFLYLRVEAVEHRLEDGRVCILCTMKCSRRDGYESCIKSLKGHGAEIFGSNDPCHPVDASQDERIKCP